MIKAIDPKLKVHGKDATFYDPCCGTGGFLAETHVYLTDPKLFETEVPENIGSATSTINTAASNQFSLTVFHCFCSVIV